MAIKGTLDAGDEATASLRERIIQAVLDVVAVVPKTGELVSTTPDSQARAIGRSAARSAATISAAAALPPGPLGLLTLVPELLAVWRVQSQMVSDIAGAYGKSATLTQEQMVYCLFRHMLAQGVRDVVVRVGERYLVRRATLQVLQKIAGALGYRISHQLLGKTVARYLPGAGAILVGGYAYYDTAKVARTAIELFSADISFEGEGAATVADVADVMDVAPKRRERTG